MASSVLNSCTARALASSVLPTPVGPRNMKEAMGRLGSLSPALDLHVADMQSVSATACRPHSTVARVGLTLCSQSFSSME